MPASIPDKYKDLFSKKAFAHLGTLMPDGSPQVTPVWCDYDGTYIRINSAKGRGKDKNMRKNKKSLSRSRIRTIPTAISPCAGRWSRSPSRERMPTSIAWRRSIWAKTSIPIAGRERFV